MTNAEHPAVTLRRDAQSTIDMLKGELVRTASAVRLLENALSPEGIAMRAQLINRVEYIRQEITRFES